MINIILFEPEIPENTGNIARTCVAFNAKLHLIKPYGFFLTSKKLKRSGVNYWEHLKMFEYDSFDDFLQQNQNPKIYMFTRYGKKSPNEFDFKHEQEIFLMFGKESSGIDKTILKNNLDYLVRIPMSSRIRSMNLSNVVAIAIYEVAKQLNFLDLFSSEPFKKL